MVFGVCLIHSVSAQETSVFKVFANQGACQLQSGKSQQPIRIGAGIGANDVLIIGEGSYVALVHTATGKALELRKAGTYPTKDLIKNISGTSNVVTRYTEFILSSNSDEARKNRLSATGAVHRGLEDLDVFLPENSSKHNRLLGDSVLIAWEPKAGVNGPFVVKITDMFGESVLDIPASGNSAKFKLPAGAESMLNVEIHRKGSSGTSSPTYSINRLDERNAKDKATVQQLRSELSELGIDQSSAIGQYILAGFYEQKALLLDALMAYDRAIRLAPDVETYRESYKEFLLRNQLKDAAKD